MDPFGLFGPTEAGADGPALVQGALDRLHVSSVSPVLTSHSLIQWCRRPRARRVFASASASGPGEEGWIELGAVRQGLLGANAIGCKGLPEVGKEAAILILVNNLVGAPIEKFDAEPLGVALLDSRSIFQSAHHGEDRTGVALALRSGARAPIYRRRAAGQRRPGETLRSTGGGASCPKDNSRACKQGEATKPEQRKSRRESRAGDSPAFTSMWRSASDTPSLV